MNDIYDRMRITQTNTPKPAPFVPSKNAPIPQFELGQTYREIPGLRRMSIQQWAAVPDNPEQRDTVKRSLKATYLNRYQPVHRLVHMAILPDGSQYKVDGHTRVYKWVNGQVPNAPDYVEVKVYYCQDIETVCKLYDCHDNSKAADDAADKMFGAMRINEIEFKSAFMKSLKYHAGLVQLHEFTYGYNNTPLRDIVARYKTALMLLDTVHCNQKRFPTGIMMAAVASLHVDGDRALPYWTKYQRDDGTKGNGKMDAVQVLCDFTVAELASRSKTAYGTTFRKALSFYLSFRGGTLYKSRNKNTIAKSDATLREFLKSGVVNEDTELC